jgi:hypothetical protein
METSYSSVLGSDDTGLVPLDASTVPTTPEGSLIFSPRLAADATDVGAMVTNNTALVVRNICCVGAGYVGM